MTHTISVIIPFFQRTTGVLRPAVESVLNQNLPENCHINLYIVDDGSPTPPEPDLEGVNYPDHITPHILKQKNGGPGEARNAALNALTTDTDFVAFLDSDDVWTTDHLSNAVLALGEEYDFYFSDFYQLNSEISAFARAGRIDTAKHQTIRDVDFLHIFEGDLFNQVITGNIIGTSTVVYRFRANSKLRFQTEYINAGEDYLFWLGFSQNNERIVFSSKCECTYGEGVNVYSGAKWGTSESINRIRYEIKYKKAIASQFKLTEQQRTRIKSDIFGKRIEFASVLLHRLHHRKSISMIQFKMQLATDAVSLIFFPVFALISLLRR